jgi:hypothetical protein
MTPLAADGYHFLTSLQCVIISLSFMWGQDNTLFGSEAHFSCGISFVHLQGELSVCLLFPAAGTITSLSENAKLVKVVTWHAPTGPRNEGGSWQLLPQ